MKKLLPYILILIILVGLFSLGGQKAEASEYSECRDAAFRQAGLVGPANTNAALLRCNGLQGSPAGSTTPVADANKVAADAQKLKQQGENGITNNLNSCEIISTSPHLNGCFEWLISKIFYEIPAFLLSIVGNFFNIIVSLTLSSTLYGSSFIGNAWTIVRDFSNIFFILVLLYIAVQTILGMGHETKKMIVHVIIMALLINFSMFFTKVIIDSSNILAQVFYNKIQVGAINYIPAVSLRNAGVQDKDISGSMMKYFDPTQVLTKEFFDKFKKTSNTASVKGALVSAAGGALVGSWIPIIGTGVGAVAGVVGYAISSSDSQIPTGIIVGLLLVAGLILIFATYCFFIAALAFLSRMIELWILIIFSPFAFMSSTIPLLKKISYIGWEEWFHRVLKLSFMAPVFLFFLYLIFTIIQSNIFAGLMDRPAKDQSWMESLILMVIPALVILILLKKATDFAKKASGELGSMVMKGAGLALGLAGGVGIGLAAKGLQATAGAASSMASNSKWLNKYEASGKFGGQIMGRTARYLKGSEFDLRTGVAGGALKLMEGATGIRTSKILSTPGGYEGDRKRAEAKRQKRNEELGVHEDEKLRQDLNNSEEDLQEMMHHVAKDFAFLDDELKDARQKKSDAEKGSQKENDAIADIARLEQVKKDIKSGVATSYVGADEQTVKVDAVTVQHGANKGKNIKDMKGVIIPKQKQAIEEEENKRTLAYADYVEGTGTVFNQVRNAFRRIPFMSEAGDSQAARRAAASKLRRGVKAKSEKEEHGHGGESSFLEHVIATAAVTAVTHDEPPKGDAHPPAH